MNRCCRLWCRYTRSRALSPTSRLRSGSRRSEAKHALRQFQGPHHLLGAGHQDHRRWHQGAGETGSRRQEGQVCCQLHGREYPQGPHPRVLGRRPGAWQAVLPQVRPSADSSPAAVTDSPKPWPCPSIERFNAEVFAGSKIGDGPGFSGLPYPTHQITEASKAMH